MSKRTRAAGFTLVELLVAIGMVAILATIGLIGYRKYLYSAQSNEAKSVIGMIRAGEEAYRSEFLVYLQPGGNTGNTFALGSYYPNKTPNNDARYAWNTNDTRYSDPTTGWALLNVSPDTAVRFGYAAIAGVGTITVACGDAACLSPMPTMPSLSAGMPWYVIQAANDHNANNIYAVFMSGSQSGEIFSQAEWE